MDPIQGNEAIQDFIKLLMENARSGQSEDLTRLIQYMDGMSRQFEAISRELTKIQRQCARDGEPYNREKYAISGMTHTLASKIQQAREKLDGLWEKIAECSASAVRDFKDYGAAALDKAISILKVKPTLETLQENINSLMDSAKRNIEKVEDMGRELRSAGAHLKNTGRAAIGKEIQTVDGGHEGHFQAAILTPMRAVHRLLSGMNNSTLAMIGGVEHLEQSAEDARQALAERAAGKPGKRLARKSSVLQALEKHREESAAAPLPTPERNPQEAAL